MATDRGQAPRSGYIATIIINVIGLVILNTLPSWHLSFITDQFPTVLWAFNLSISATIVANALFLAYDAAWFKHIAQIALNGLAVVVLYTLYRVFPFAFGPLGNQLGHIALLLCIFAVGIATVVELVGLVRVNQA